MMFMRGPLALAALSLLGSRALAAVDLTSALRQSLYKRADTSSYIPSQCTTNCTFLLTVYSACSTDSSSATCLSSCTATGLPQIYDCIQCLFVDDVNPADAGAAQQDVNNIEAACGLITATGSTSTGFLLPALSDVQTTATTLLSLSTVPFPSTTSTATGGVTSTSVQGTVIVQSTALTTASGTKSTATVTSVQTPLLTIAGSGSSSSAAATSSIKSAGEKTAAWSMGITGVIAFLVGAVAL